MYVDVWDHFSNDRSLFSEDGLHLNRVGKARLGEFWTKVRNTS